MSEILPWLYNSFWCCLWYKVTADLWLSGLIWVHWLNSLNQSQLHSGAVPYLWSLMRYGDVYSEHRCDS